MMKNKRLNVCRKIFAFVLFFTIFSSLIYAKNSPALWTGLRDKQPESELPKGKAPFQISQRVTKENIPVSFEAVSDNEWLIAQGWEMTDGKTVTESRQWLFDTSLDTKLWYNATVPGTVLTTLVNQGVYPDPFFGLNNMAIPEELCRKDWWYRAQFKLPKDIQDNQIDLLLNGINYAAEVYLNGKKLGDIKGAFIRGQFDITDVVKKSEENVLAVHILPPNNPGIPHEQSMEAGQGFNGGVLSTDGPTFISSIGWDWIPGIRDRNIGIWQDVRIKSRGSVAIGDPLVISQLMLPDTTQAKLTIKTTIKNRGKSTVKGELKAKIESITISTPYELSAGEEREILFSPVDFKELIIKNPRLWWPNGYGKQELYALELESTVGSKQSDRKKMRFGIRELSYELMINDRNKENTRIAYTPVKNTSGKPVFDYQNRTFFTKENQLPTLTQDADVSILEKLTSDDPIGPFLAIRVNGVRIFCRGGNWGMDDGMKRSSRERLEPYVKLHQEANFNIIRNWTGESTEETFYELCDEYGMLVWNDFWITTDDTVEPSDFQLFLRNATDVVRRFRNHPSIAIWCPRNEGFAPEGLGEPLFAMIAKEDPTRHCHGQSRFLNMGISGPWGYFKDPSLYYTQNAKGFNTELGSYAIPTANTIRKFIAKEDQWPINDVWAYHDLHHKSQNFKDFMAAVDRYGKAENLDDFVRKSQFVTYDAWRNMLESWNSKMWNNTTGLILWMSHPAWPSMIWQTYTYDYETPGSYFGAKKACEPLHIQMNLPNRDIVIVNSTRVDFKNLEARYTHIGLDGKIIQRGKKRVEAARNSLTPCFDSIGLENLPDLYLCRLELFDLKKSCVSTNDYWVSENGDEGYAKINSLPRVNVISKVKNKDINSITLEVHNPSKTIAAGVKLNAVNKTNGEIILPAYFSDGYFNLLPNEKRIITLELPANKLQKVDIVADGYNIIN